MQLFKLIAALALALYASGARAEDAKDSSLEDLAKAAQNPIADMVSVPFQNVTAFRVGPYRQTADILNIQPVVPFHLNEDWNLITRTTIPVVSQVRSSQFHGPMLGIGDVNQILAFSPANSGSVIWGVGPTISYPTASERLLGAEKWSAGPTFVALFTPDPWVVGVLANNIWSFSGSHQRERVSQMMAQYFINYNFSDGSYISSSPIVTANWAGNGRDRWVVPVGGGVGRLFLIEGQAVDAQIGAYYNVVRPESGPRWQVRFDLSFLFPK